jgi:hypothetical protein
MTAYLQGAQPKMQSEKEGQSKSEIIVVDFDWPSGLLNMGHLGTPLTEDNWKQR